MKKQKNIYIYFFYFQYGRRGPSSFGGPRRAPSLPMPNRATAYLHV